MCAQLSRLARLAGGTNLSKACRQMLQSAIAQSLAQSLNYAGVWNKRLEEPAVPGATEPLLRGANSTFESSPRELDFARRWRHW